MVAGVHGSQGRSIMILMPAGQLVLISKLGFGARFWPRKEGPDTSRRMRTGKKLRSRKFKRVQVFMLIEGKR